MNEIFDPQDRCITILGRGYVNSERRAVLQTRPQQYQNIAWLYRYITAESCGGRATQMLRQLVESGAADEAREWKKLAFDVALFAGVFSERRASCLVRRSPFVVVDIDHLASLQEARELKYRLAADPCVATALAFVSPSGRGVKWVVELPAWAEGLTFRQQYQQLCVHVGFRYGIRADGSCTDVCRSCFLPYDPHCYVNRKYIETL